MTHCTGRIHRALIGVSSSVVLLVAACASDAAEPEEASAPKAGASAGSGAAAAGTTAAKDSSAATQPTAATAAKPAGTASAAAGGMTIATDETWSDGKTLPGSIDIAAGTKVQIAPGAKISVPAGASITVHGTLEAAAKDSHAKLSGTGWTGVVVASGGSMSLSGVDIEGAKQALAVNGGNTSAEYSYGTISDGLFKIDKGGNLALDHVAVTKGGYSFVSGSLKATFLDYSGAGIALGDATANAFVADSKLSGTGADFFTANGGQLLHVEYSTVDGSHCPFHFNSITKFEIDHVTTGGSSTMSTSAYGWMIYNGDAGPHSISFSNFYDPSWEQTRPSVAINVMNTYIKSVKVKAGQVTFTPADASGNNGQLEPNADAQPRGVPGPG